MVATRGWPDSMGKLILAGSYLDSGVSELQIGAAADVN
jgi:hypothetical protein